MRILDLALLTWYEHADHVYPLAALVFSFFLSFDNVYVVNTKRDDSDFSLSLVVLVALGCLLAASRGKSRAWVATVAECWTLIPQLALWYPHRRESRFELRGAMICIELQAFWFLYDHFDDCNDAIGMLLWAWNATVVLALLVVSLRTRVHVVVFVWSLALWADVVFGISMWT